jgi:hypothetical protein
MLAGMDCCRDHPLRQAFTTAVREEERFIDLPPNTLRELIKGSKEEDLAAKEARWALTLPQGPVMKCPGDNKINHYNDTWEVIDSLLYQKKRLYVPPAAGVHKEIL